MKNHLMAVLVYLVVFPVLSTADDEHPLLIDEMQLLKSLIRNALFTDSKKADVINIPSNHNWFDDLEGTTSPCNWTGIKCDNFHGDGLITVSHIDLPCNRQGASSLINLPFPSWLIAKFKSLRHLNLSHCALTGVLENQFWDLENLEILDLSQNRLSGMLPPSIAKLKSLKQLILDGNHFSGSLPSEIGKLTQLIELSLHSNSFSGKLPEQIGNLNQLQSLDLSSNAFSGSLPKSLSNLTSLLYFTARNNKLTGTLFPEIGKLWKLRILDLSLNSFNGILPSSIGNLTKLTTLNLGNCMFTGNLPEEISNLTQLSYLNLARNDFNGELPARSIGRLINLVYFIAPDSKLIGKIPSDLGNCTKLKVIDLSFNSMQGPLPDSFAGLKSINSILLGSNRLSGGVPLWISSWKQVATIILSENLLSGPLPPLSSLPLLSHFDVSANNLSGDLPADMCNINGQSSLTTLDLSSNNFSGSIGDGLFESCRNLTDLILNENNISGELPGYLGEMEYLMILEISKNKLSGSIPDKLYESISLLEISLSDNLLQGPISDSIANVSTLERLQLDNNLLTGTIPNSIGKLKNLTNLSLHGNQLTGEIPPELFDCTRLVSLDLGLNHLSGKIPRSVSHLKSLDNLVLSNNRMSGPIPEEICSGGFQNVPLPDSEFIQHYGMLDLSYNELEGPIPLSIKQCTVVTHLLLQGNKLNGSIPDEEIASLANLTLLDLSFNALSGSLNPQLLIKLRSLQGLILSHNQFKGSIPVWMTSSTHEPNLTKLDLSNNHFTGLLPPSLFIVQSLAYLDVSMNFLSGPLSVETIRDSDLIVLNASNNRFNGPLDDSVSNLTSLSVLDLHRNMFSGSIPVSLSNLEALTYLDLSENNFQDSNFPCNVCAIQGLTFANFTGINIIGQSCSHVKRCNNILGPHNIDLPLHRRQEYSLSRVSLFSIAVIVTVIFALLFICLILMKWKMPIIRQDAIILQNSKNKLVEVTIANKFTNTSSDDEGLIAGKKLIKEEPLSINLATFEHILLRINAADILSATENFSKSYIIGDGGFGTVYRASLPGGRLIAVKRLNGYLHAGDREFLAEIETLGKVKHENLVPLLGYGLFADERFLIYEYMANGSLDFWLTRNNDHQHYKKKALDWPTRFKICLGSARGLAFLHHGFVPHIIHRDIKSSNILLDSNFQPRVSDFGLARIISAYESHVSTMLAGTLGYIPPEYGQTMEATTRGDVYSFGVVMLELVTGREPTGQADIEGGNLVGWIRWMLRNGRELDEVIDVNLVCSSDGLNWKDEILCVLNIARSCTHDQPWMRPTMLQVVRLLKKAKMMRRGG